MRLNVVKTNSREKVPTTAGTVRHIMTATDAGAGEARASLHDIDPNRSLEFDSGTRAHLLYVIEGSADLTDNAALQNIEGIKGVVGFVKGEAGRDLVEFVEIKKGGNDDCHD